MDLDRLWKNTCEELKIVLAPAVFNTFVSPSQLIALKDNTVTIACPNSYLLDINKKRYYQFFKDALDNQTKLSTNIEFIIQESIRPQPTSPAPLFAPLHPTNISHDSNPRDSGLKAGLHPRYTFDNFVVGNSNNFAYAAAQGVVKNPGISYNPFFIWGGVGVGKTHLMQAIGWQLLHQNSSLKIKYFPAETFGNELVSALRTKNINQFKDKYRSLDCILIDDIQFIAGKEYIQEEFFHTFNALHLSGRQVILTSDRKPQEIKDLSDRLVSRFLGGLTVDIQTPDLETRIAIVRQKSEEKGISIDTNAATVFAQHLDSNIRDLEGQLQKLLLQAQSQHLTQITPDVIYNLTSSTTHTSPTPANVTPRHLISISAQHFDIKTGDLCGKARRQELVLARHITAFLLIEHLHLPLEEVGRLLGGRDHTSIMHARDKIKSELSTSTTIQSHLKAIKQKL